MKQVLVVDKIHKSALDFFKEKGVKCTYLPEINYEKAVEIIQDYDAVLIRSKFKIDKNFIDKASNLKVIARAGAGLENIDTEYCKAKNIQVVNSPEGNRDAVAEHILAMLLMYFNKINIASAQVKNGVWDRENNWGEELSKKTVGIIGYGNMGQALAKRLACFDTEILVYDKYKTGFSNKMVKEVPLTEIQKNADILSFHVPLTNETKYYFDDEFAMKMQKQFYLINTSRGAVVNTKSLVKCLKNNKIKAAFLDVLEYEKFNFENAFLDTSNADLQYLIKSDNVVLTPHIAGWTNQSFEKISLIAAQKIVSNLALQ